MPDIDASPGRSLSAIAAEILRQVAPEWWHALGTAGEQHLRQMLRQLDIEAGLRLTKAVDDGVREATKFAVLRPEAPPTSIPLVPDEEIARADEQGEKANECLDLAQGLDWTLDDPARQASVAALVSSAHSAREQSILLRAIAAAVERRSVGA